MEEFTINIAKDFNDSLGGRWIRLGPFSGEAFYENILKIKFESALNAKSKLNIYLDGTKGYGSSFLDQSFGELSRNYNFSDVKNTIVFNSQNFKLSACGK